MSTWPAPRPLTAVEQREALAPFGRGWAKLIEAFRKKLEGMTDDELTQLIEACRNGRWHHHLGGNDYAASFEVERNARAILHSRTKLRKVS